MIMRILVHLILKMLVKLVCYMVSIAKILVFKGNKSRPTTNFDKAMRNSFRTIFPGAKKDFGITFRKQLCSEKILVYQPNCQDEFSFDSFVNRNKYLRKQRRFKAVKSGGPLQ